MLFEFDQTADALYVRLHEGMVSRTVELEPGTLVDLDDQGEALGIEVIRPARAVAVEEIADRFNLAPDVRSALTSLWRRDSRYPWSPAEPLLSAAG